MVSTTWSRELTSSLCRSTLKGGSMRGGVFCGAGAPLGFFLGLVAARPDAGADGCGGATRFSLSLIATPPERRAGDGVLRGHDTDGDKKPPMPSSGANV